MEALIVICSFNDGNKGPNDHANEQLILPDVFSLVAVNRDGTFERIILPQHRCYEKTKREPNRDMLRNHKKLNKALKQMALHNSSSETWLDRVRNTTYNRTKSFVRNEAECFKQLFAFCNKNSKERIFSELDKVFLGKGVWADADQFQVLSSAIHTDKTRGIVTILLHVIWDVRQEQVCMWNIKTDQWFKSGESEESSKIMLLLR